MPETIKCLECGATLLGVDIEDAEPTPIGRDSCPMCDATEFAACDGLES